MLQKASGQGAWSANQENEPARPMMLSKTSTATLPMDTTNSCARESQSGQSVFSDQVWMGWEAAIRVEFDLIVAEPQLIITQNRIRSRVA